MDFSNSRSRTIIFDLEMNYPYKQEDCRGASLNFNADEPDNFIIGGVFASFNISDVKDRDFGARLKYEHFWCEDASGERKVLKDIYEYIEQAWESLNKTESKDADLILCGVGISSVDVPSLYIRCLRQNVDSANKLFSTLFKARQVDLSHTGIPLLGRGKRVLHPISKRDLAKICGMAMPETITFDVRRAFEQKRFAEIKQRTEFEVRQIAQCYWHLSGYALQAKNPYA